MVAQIGLKSARGPRRGDQVRFDRSEVESSDGCIAGLLVQSKWDLHAAGIGCEFIGEHGPVKQILDLCDSDVRPNPHAAKMPVGILAQIGQTTLDVFYEVQLVLAFFGSMLIALEQCEHQ